MNSAMLIDVSGTCGIFLCGSCLAQSVLLQVMLFGRFCCTAVKLGQSQNDEEKGLIAFEVWFLWRMIEILRTEKKSNLEVPREAGVQRTIIKTIRQRQFNFLGHVIRRHGLKNLAVSGKV